MKLKQVIYLSLFALLNLGTASAQSIPGPQVSGIPVLIPAIIVVTLAVIGATVYTLMKDKGEDPEERLEMLVNHVELELEEGQTVEESHVADEVQMAEDALENEEYDRASEIMEDIEQKIE